MKNGPQITSSGLSLSLDAGNVISYVGSGTSWFNMAGNESITLSNGPTYSTEKLGSIIFDGANDYADFTVSGLSSVATIEMWVKLGAGYSGRMFMGWSLYDIYCAGGGIGFNTAASDQYGITGTAVTNLNLVGNWAHYIFEMRSDVSYTNNKIYINGNLQSGMQQTFGSESATNRNFNNGVGRIACWRNDLNYPMPMNLNVFNIYNRSLSSIEIQQNFNALRGRFGI